MRTLDCLAVYAPSSLCGPWRGVPVRELFLFRRGWLVLLPIAAHIALSLLSC